MGVDTEARGVVILRIIWFFHSGSAASHSNKSVILNSAYKPNMLTNHVSI